MEAWIVAWSNMDTREHSHYFLYSGGDESVLCKNGDPHGSSYYEDYVLHFPLEVLVRDTKTHSAGVTAILPIRIGETSGQQVVITGSYDEHIRVLRLGNGVKKSQVLAEKRLYGGGVWRLKLLGYEQVGDNETMTEVLASCMHAGTRVLNIHCSREGVWSIRVVAKFVEHESMNYASDARHNLPEEKPGMTIVSTSFYDRKLCVWNWEQLTRDHE